MRLLIFHIVNALKHFKIFIFPLKLKYYRNRFDVKSQEFLGIVFLDEKGFLEFLRKFIDGILSL